MRTVGPPRRALPALLALSVAAGAQTAPAPASTDADPGYCSPLSPQRAQELQAELLALGDPVVVLRQRGGAQAVKMHANERIEDALRALGATVARIEAERAPLADQEQKAIDALIKAMTDPSLQDGVLMDPDLLAAKAPQVADALTALAAAGNSYLHLVSGNISDPLAKEHMKALAQAAKDLQLQGTSLKDAFASRLPGDPAASAAPEDPRSRLLDFISGAMDAQYRYSASLKSQTSPLPASASRSGTPPEPGAVAAAPVGGTASVDAKTAALEGLSQVPILREWALPRLAESRGQGGPADDDRRFKDAYGATMELETIADRYFSAVCREKSANNAATDFLVRVVDARGHTESGSMDTAWDYLRQGRLLDVEDSRYGPRQLKTGTLPGNPLITASYQEWAELDHFAQSVADASDHLAGIPGVLHGVVSSSLGLDHPRLEAVGHAAVRAATFPTEVASSLHDHDLDWRGDGVSEWLTSVKNAGWSGLKAAHVVRGSSVDWAQYQAGQRGVRYAAELRRGLVDQHLSFCDAVAQRAQ